MLVVVQLPLLCICGDEYLTLYLMQEDVLWAVVGLVVVQLPLPMASFGYLSSYELTLYLMQEYRRMKL